MIITIDGYAGTGKSTVARLLAERLGFELLNTGAMYRALALDLSASGIDIYADPPPFSAIEQRLAQLAIQIDQDRVLLNGVDVTDRLGSEEASRGSSRVATFLCVRRKLQEEQRQVAAGRNIVCEGRDQGTAVFPNAPLKFFLYADPKIRAERRTAQLRQNNEIVDPAKVYEEIIKRDHQDENREHDPLRAAEDAIRLDTSHISIEELVQQMLTKAEQCRQRI